MSQSIENWLIQCNMLIYLLSLSKEKNIGLVLKMANLHLILPLLVHIQVSHLNWLSMFCPEKIVFGKEISLIYQSQEYYMHTCIIHQQPHLQQESTLILCHRKISVQLFKFVVQNVYMPHIFLNFIFVSAEVGHILYSQKFQS